MIGLTIDNVKPEDAGKYSLTVSNRLGDISGEAPVEVSQREKKPIFFSELQPVKVVEGFPVKLEVQCVGHPTPSIKWTHNGKEVVPDGEHIKITNLPDGTCCLIIDKAQPSDAGEYAIHASNEKGEASSKGSLEVAGNSYIEI